MPGMFPPGGATIDATNPAIPDPTLSGYRFAARCCCRPKPPACSLTIFGCGCPVPGVAVTITKSGVGTFNGTTDSQGKVYPDCVFFIGTVTITATGSGRFGSFTRTGFLPFIPLNLPPASGYCCLATCCQPVSTNLTCTASGGVWDGETQAMIAGSDCVAWGPAGPPPPVNFFPVLGALNRDFSLGIECAAYGPAVMGPLRLISLTCPPSFQGIWTTDSDPRFVNPCGDFRGITFTVTE